MIFARTDSRLCEASVFLLALLLTLSLSRAAAAGGDIELLQVREQVWRAWFANEQPTLTQLVPAETIVVSAGEERRKNRADVFHEAAEFQAGGGKLISLEFPKTEIQHFGDVAIVWSNYRLKTEVKGKQSVSAGRVTEIFLRRDGK